MVLFILEDIIFRYSLDINLVSSIIPKCFWDNDRKVLALSNTNAGLDISFALRLKNNFLSLLCRVCIKVHFPLKMNRVS